MRKLFGLLILSALTVAAVVAWADEEPSFPFIQLSKFREYAGIGSAVSTRPPGKIVAINFTAKWCTYCPRMRRQLVKLKESFGESLEVYQIDWNNEVEEFVVAERNVARSLPGVTFFRDGEFLAKSASLAEVEPSAWLAEQIRRRDALGMRTATPESFPELLKIRGRDVLVVIWNGMHMYHDDLLASALEAKAARPDRVSVFEMESATVRDSAFVNDPKNQIIDLDPERDEIGGGYVGVSLVLIRDGKIVKKNQDRPLDQPVLEWLDR